MVHLACKLPTLPLEPCKQLWQVKHYQYDDVCKQTFLILSMQVYLRLKVLNKKASART